MTTPHFDLIMTGELAPGHSRDAALTQLSALFKRPVDQIEKLLNGRPNRIRKDLSEADLQRYQALFAKIGVITLAQASSAAPRGETATPPVAEPTPQSATPTTSSLSMSPPGTPVLREEERHFIATAAPDTDHLSLAASGVILADADERPPVPEPNTDDFSLAQAGDDLLPPSLAQIEVDLDALTADLSLCDIGTPVLDEKPAANHPTPDTSHLSLK
ncbi:hypothetical protein AB4876_13570 [Zhongshania guokunii]|uniref:Uncharacterized protein n=1 Tax=Zhongshania guokunii TaxID=641783 RepID=A0ABV3U8V5_9GAMM